MSDKKQIVPKKGMIISYYTDNEDEVGQTCIFTGNGTEAVNLDTLEKINIDFNYLVFVKIDNIFDY